MADQKEELHRALRGFIGDQLTVTIFPAEVKSTNLELMTCDVVDTNEIEIFDVRMRADTSAADGFILLPKVGSTVLVGNIGNSPGEHCLVHTSEVDQVYAVVNGTRLEVKPAWVLMQRDTTSIQIKADGIYLKKGVETLKKVLDDLIVAINAITVTCAAPGSPSTPPLNIAAFNAIKTRVDNLLK